MYLLSFYFLTASLLPPLFGRRLGNQSIFLGILLLFISFLTSLFLFYESVYCETISEIILFNWIDFFSLKVSFSLYFDSLSTSMYSLVLFISFLVHYYASNYMENDPCKIRFFFYLSLFTFFMSLMVLSNSLLQFFFAWEGVGLASYLLINFWFTRVEANRAAMKAMIVNRFGDFGLYLAILLIFSYCKLNTFSNLNFVSQLLQKITLFGWEFSIAEVLAALFFLAVVGKSAQLGLHTWLPDAMEGPTPVSALLHAATMVTAGVYLLLRLSPFLTSAPKILLVISFWGALTAFFASTVGAFQYDIKKVIAYSTCSQLGYMVAACGMLNFSGSYFHLFNHAFFKALLFLGAGSIIHALGDEQDMRKYGMLINFLPLTYICMLIASLSLIGFPFLSGFYSKELVINWAFMQPHFFGSMVYWLLVFAAFFTSLYSTKLLYLTFFSRVPRFSYVLLRFAEESDYRFKVPLFLLALFSVFSGYLFYDLFVGYGSPMHFLEVQESNIYYFDLEIISSFRKTIPLLFVLLGSFFYFFFNLIFQVDFHYLLERPVLSKVLIILRDFFNKKWYFDYFYYLLVHKIMQFSYDFLFKTVDRGFLEFIFIKAPVSTLQNFGLNLNRISNADVNIYIIYFLNILIQTFIVLLFVIFSIPNILFCFYIFYLFKNSLSRFEK